MSEFPSNFSNKNCLTFTASPLDSNCRITPFECNNSPLPFMKERLNFSEEMLKTNAKTKGSPRLDVKKIKEIISNIDVKNPYHLIFEAEEESPTFENSFKEFLRRVEELDKNLISILHELCHNLKIEINVQIEPKIQGLEKSSRSIK